MGDRQGNSRNRDGKIQERKEEKWGGKDYNLKDEMRELKKKRRDEKKRPKDDGKGIE